MNGDDDGGDMTTNPAPEPMPGMPPGTDPSPAPPVSRHGTRGLKAYLDENRSRFTEDALKAATIEAGWDEQVVDTLLGKVRAAERSRPLRARAWRIVLILYVAAFLVLSAGMLVNPAARVYGGAVIGIVVLAVALLVTAGLGRLWLRRKGISPAMSSGDLMILLAVPVILWLAVAGICVATGLPIPRPLA